MRVKVANMYSGTYGKTGYTSKKDWESGSYWVPVSINGQYHLVARRDLREA